MEQICDGLAFAHAKDVVHRDLKPGNIHIQRERPDQDHGLRAGAAGVVRHDAGRHRSWARRTTCPRSRCAARRPTPARTCSRWGAVFYELLTSRKPFEADSIARRAVPGGAERAGAAVQPDPRHPARPAAGRRAGDDQDPNVRFRDAGEMREALRPARSAMAHWAGSSMTPPSRVDATIVGSSTRRRRRRPSGCARPRPARARPHRRTRRRRCHDRGRGRAGARRGRRRTRSRPGSPARCRAGPPPRCPPRLRGPRRHRRRPRRRSRTRPAPAPGCTRRRPSRRSRIRRPRRHRSCTLPRRCRPCRCPRCRRRLSSCGAASGAPAARGAAGCARRRRHAGRRPSLDAGAGAPFRARASGRRRRCRLEDAGVRGRSGRGGAGGAIRDLHADPAGGRSADATARHPGAATGRPRHHGARRGPRRRPGREELQGRGPRGRAGPAEGPAERRRQAGRGPGAGRAEEDRGRGRGRAEGHRRQDTAAASKALEQLLSVDPTNPAVPQFREALNGAFRSRAEQVLQSDMKQARKEATQAKARRSPDFKGGGAGVARPPTRCRWPRASSWNPRQAEVLPGEAGSFDRAREGAARCSRRWRWSRRSLRLRPRQRPRAARPSTRAGPGRPPTTGERGAGHPAPHRRLRARSRPATSRQRRSIRSGAAGSGDQGRRRPETGRRSTSPSSRSTSCRRGPSSASRAADIGADGGKTYPAQCQTLTLVKESSGWKITSLGR